MTEDKPLHVQVAEALGWGDCHAKRHRPDEWWGLFDPYSGYRIIPRYDTDWSATGPLIEKHKIMVWPWDDTKWAAERRVDLAEDPASDSFEFGPTPIIAVCNLILALSKAGRLQNPPDSTQQTQDNP